MKPIHLSAYCLSIALFAAPGGLTASEDADTPNHDLTFDIVAELEEAPGNLTVTPEGRIFMSIHQHFSPDLRMAELDPADSTRLIPFPNETMATDAPEAPLALNSVLGVQTDDRGVVWMLDNAMRRGEIPKLVGWKPDADGGSLHQVIYLPAPAVKPGPFLNDLAVDRQRETIYIADTSRSGNPALIVVDTATGLARRVLENHISVQAESMPTIADGEKVFIRREDGSTFNPQVAVNPIALDAAREYLYYGPMTGTQLYRIPTAALRDASLTDAELAGAVELWAERPISDGISVDRAGNVYISALGQSEIGVIPAETRQYETLVKDDSILWPDAFSFGPDGFMYVVVNQLHRGPLLNAGVDASEPPYHIIRFKPLVPGVVGR